MLLSPLMLCNSSYIYITLCGTTCNVSSFLVRYSLIVAVVAVVGVGAGKRQDEQREREASDPEVDLEVRFWCDL